MLSPVLLGVLIGLLVCQVANVATTVYLHRTLSHRSLRVRPGLGLVFRVVTWITTGIRPRQWVAVHRKHHAHTDVEGDPHSPLLDGFATVLFGNVGLYRKVAKDDDQVARYARDQQPDRWDRILFDHALLGLAIGIALLVVIWGPVVALVASVVHTVTYLFLSGCVNAIGHRYGKKPHDNDATNNQWLAWLTAGEGLHNNHHHQATSPRLSMASGEIDPGWWFITAARKLGWATVRERRAERVEEPIAA